MVGLHISAPRLIMLRRAARGEGDYASDLIRPAAVVWAPPARGRDACYAVLACVCECEMLLRLFWRAEICAMSSSEGERDAADATLLQWYDDGHVCWQGATARPHRPPSRECAAVSVCSVVVRETRVETRGTHWYTQPYRLHSVHVMYTTWKCRLLRLLEPGES